MPTMGRDKLRRKMKALDFYYMSMNIMDRAKVSQKQAKLILFNLQGIIDMMNRQNLLFKCPFCHNCSFSSGTLVSLICVTRVIDPSF